MRLIITRSEPYASELAEKLKSMGHIPHIEPLLEVKFCECEIPQLDFSALVITSQHTLRAIKHNNDLTRLQNIPLCAVGPATSAYARELGFNKVYEAAGTAKDLIPLISQHISPDSSLILYLSGKDIAYDLSRDLRQSGYKVHHEILYKTVAAKGLSSQLKILARNRELDGVLLMSPKTSKIWADLISDAQDIGLLTEVTAYCLSTAIAEPINKFKNLTKKIARKPNIDDLLALIE